ncbi:MAG: glycosyltransferase family 87 protein [Thermomicrobiales bacterium]
MPDIARFMAPLTRYYRPGTGAVRVGPAPYPPPFLKLFEPFTLPSPPIGFLAWTILNAVIAIVVIRRLAGRFTSSSPRKLTMLLFSIFPLMMSLFVGQVEILLLLFVMQACLDLERKRDFRAGAWFGLLLLKPQYAICLFIVLAIKGRIAAVAGFMTGGLVILAGSIAVAGLKGTIAYVRLLFNAYPAFAGGVAIDPQGMIGWRGMMVMLWPQMSGGAGILIVGFLSLLSIALLPHFWRGPWEPGTTRFWNQLTATFAITLMVAYYSQPHGAVLLVVPGCLLLSRTDAPIAARYLLVASAVAAPLVAIFSALTIGDLSMVSFAMSVVLIGLVCILLRDSLTPESVQSRNRAEIDLVPGPL